MPDADRPQLKSVRVSFICVHVCFSSGVFLGERQEEACSSLTSLPLHQRCAQGSPAVTGLGRGRKPRPGWPCDRRPWLKSLRESPKGVVFGACPLTGSLQESFASEVRWTKARLLLPERQRASTLVALRCCPMTAAILGGLVPDLHLRLRGQCTLSKKLAHEDSRSVSEYLRKLLSRLFQSSAHPESKHAAASSASSLSNTLEATKQVALFRPNVAFDNCWCFFDSLMLLTAS